MDSDSRSPTAGSGCLVAICLMAGAALGVVFHQISAGILIGLAVGALVALVLWLQDRDKGRE